MGERYMAITPKGKGRRQQLFTPLEGRLLLLMLGLVVTVAVMLVFKRQ